MKICIDPGHYANYNPGVSSGYYEGNAMLILGNHLKSALQSYGASVVMTRTSGNQNPSLENRGATSKGCDMFISLHTNAVGMGVHANPANTVIGFRSIKYPESADLGNKICNTVAQVLKAADSTTRSQGITTRLSDDKVSDWYGVIRSACRYVKYSYLIEHGFHTNTKQCAWLNNSDNLKKIADAEAKVIADYFGLKGGGSTGETTTGGSVGGTTTSTTQSVKYKMTTDVKIMKSPSSSGGDTGNICKNGQTVIVTETTTDSYGNVWGHINSGWICLKYVGKSQTNLGSTSLGSTPSSSGSASTVTSPGTYRVSGRGSLREFTAPGDSGQSTGVEYDIGATVNVVGFETINATVWAKLSNGNYILKSIKNVMECLSYVGPSTTGSSDLYDYSVPQVSQEKIDAFNALYVKQQMEALKDATGHATSAATGFSDYYINLYNQQVKNMSDYANCSLRMFGVPHQFTEEVDPRITATSGLGRNFTESLIAEAPIVYVMPGKTDFLSGANSKTKEGWLSVLGDAFKGDTDGLGSKIKALLQTDDQDIIRYFGFKPAYIQYMYKVNMLCRICAYYMGLWDLPVPWHSDFNIKLGYYDWRFFNFSSVYNYSVKPAHTDKSVWENLLGLAAFEFETMTSDYDQGDDRWLQFYVEASSTSYSESISNSVGDSILAQYTDQLSSIGRELQTVTGMSGLDISGAISNVTSSVDDFIQKITANGGAIGTFLQRLTSNTNQILEGANFLVPQVWQDSTFNKSYSFTITLSSPYGNPISYYLNILVPLMHIIGFSVPEQETANTYKAPNIVRIFSPGWFSSDMGMVESIQIDKGSDNGWAISSLPTEVKVTISVRDLYASLGIPIIRDMGENAAVNLMTNTGLTDYLMVISGVDLSKPEIGRQKRLVFRLLAGDTVEDVLVGGYRVKNLIQETIRNIALVI